MSFRHAPSAMDQAPAPFETAHLTRKGRRSDNEDRAGFEVVGGCGCWVMADGLGGHPYGEVAAELAVDGVLKAFRANPRLSPEILRDCLAAGQAAVQSRQRQNPAMAEMRTTAVVLLAESAQACWGHVGDSRLYLFRDGRAVTRTLDHSIAQALVSIGEIEESALRHDPDRSRLLRNMGGPGPLRASVLGNAVPLDPGDVFLLCSDGFWEPLLEPVMEGALSPATTMRAWLERLAGLIEAYGDPSQDNYTALAVRIGGASIAP